MSFSVYDYLHKGEYYTDFSFLNKGELFPSKEIIGRNIIYKYRHRQYTGQYSYNKNLIIRMKDREMEIPYKVMSTNYFKLLTNKITDIIFNNDIIVKSGDIERDKRIQDLIENTQFFDKIRSGFKKTTEFGDAGIKVYKNGVSIFNMTRGFKVVDANNIEDIKAEVLYYPIFGKKDNYIDFQIYQESKVFEIVKKYYGADKDNFGFIQGTIGESVDYEIKGRKIPAGGVWYDTGISDAIPVNIMSINQEANGIYGESLYQDIQDIVYGIEQRLSVNMHLLDNSMTPFIVVGSNMVTQNERTGKVELKLINGQVMVSDHGNTDAQVIELNYNLDNSNDMLATLKEFLYELSEMGRTFLSGEMTGNPSEETINNVLKSSIDKANRLITEVYYTVRNSLYCLCLLNGIDIKKSDLNIIFNIGRTDSDKNIADVSSELVNNKILSRRSVRQKYFGYNDEQSDQEDIQIVREAELNVPDAHIDNSLDENN